MPAKNGYDKIQYPRKCEHCDYVSNNPSMYHYHKKTHEPIPEGQICEHGCGRPATVLNTHGKYTCLPKAQQCPEYKKQQASRVANQWLNPGNDDRRQATKEKFAEHCSGNEVARDKMRRAIKKKWGDFTPEQMKDRRHYARRIRQRAQKWAKEQGYELGQQTFHVDHKLSIYDAWCAGLPESIVNHPANLQVIESKKNSSKGAKSILTVDELLKLIEKSKNANTV